MKKGDILEGTIECVEYPNKGIILLDGERIVVKNGIPGQKVKFQITRKRSGHHCDSRSEDAGMRKGSPEENEYESCRGGENKKGTGARIEGRILAVTEASPYETRKPLCTIFPACGGCMYQTMDYPSQLHMKEQQIYSLLQPVLQRYGQSLPWEGIFGSPRETAYRNKMEYSFGDAVKDGPLTLGFHKKGSSYDVLTASDCCLVHPDMNRILSCVLDYYTELAAPYYRKLSHIGYLRHLLLRRGCTTGEILVHVVTTSQMEYPTDELVERLLSLPLEGRIVGILHILNDSLSDTVQSDETRLLWGKDFFMEKLLGLSFRISTFSFFQPNSYAAEVLYTKVREYLGDTDGQTVFDLYSGTGTIAQLAAASAREVIGVEIVAEAVEAAKENARLNGLDNCRFITGDVLKVLSDLPEKPDTIILDPPRDGIHPRALPEILRLNVPNIIYISCKATSLARDLPMFLEAGYQVKKACCVDQFCQTVHVETIVLMTRNT